jgi:hypothetical protein
MELDYSEDRYCKILMELLQRGRISPNNFRDDLEKYEEYINQFGIESAFGVKLKKD